jgi:hypothetical protein
MLIFSTVSRIKHPRSSEVHSDLPDRLAAASPSQLHAVIDLDRNSTA